MRGGATSAFLTVSAFYERFFVIFGDVLRSSGGGVWCEVIEPARWLLRSTAVLRALAACSRVVIDRLTGRGRGVCCVVRGLRARPRCCTLVT
jgi:hypothetical protein